MAEAENMVPLRPKVATCASASNRAFQAWKIGGRACVGFSMGSLMTAGARC